MFGDSLEGETSDEVVHVVDNSIPVAAAEIDNDRCGRRPVVVNRWTDLLTHPHLEASEALVECGT